MRIRPRLFRLLLIAAVAGLSLACSAPAQGQTADAAPAQGSQNDPALRQPLQAPAPNAPSPGEIRWEQLKLKQDWPGQFSSYDGEIGADGNYEAAKERGDGEARTAGDWLHAECWNDGISGSGEEIIRTIFLDASRRRDDVAVSAKYPALAPGNGLEARLSRAAYHSVQMEVFANQEEITLDAITRMKQELGEDDFKKFDRPYCERAVKTDIEMGKGKASLYYPLEAFYCYRESGKAPGSN